MLMMMVNNGNGHGSDGYTPMVYSSEITLAVLMWEVAVIWSVGGLVVLAMTEILGCSQSTHPQKKCRSYMTAMSAETGTYITKVSSEGCRWLAELMSLPSPPRNVMSAMRPSAWGLHSGETDCCSYQYRVSKVDRIKC